MSMGLSPSFRAPGSWLPLLLATPAMAGLATVAALAAVVYFGPDDTVFYRRKALRAAQRGDGRSQAFALECLLALDPANRATRWELAQVYRNNRQPDRFAAISADLMPMDKPGFGPAQRDAAKAILDAFERQPPTSHDEQSRMLERALAHLRQSLVDQPKNPEAVERLVDLLSAMENDSEALELVADLPPNALSPSLAIRKAWLESKGNAAKVPDSVISLSGALETLAAKPNAPDHVRRAHAMACELRGNLSGAFEIWSGQMGDHRPRLRQSEGRRHLVGLHVRRADECLSKLPRDWEGMAESVHRGLSLDPNAAMLLERLVLLANPAGSRSETPDNRQARDRALSHVNDLLAKGANPALLHMLLAAEYHRNRRQEMARLHFELSYRADPKMTVVANNLAWYLVNTTPRDPERALALVNAALASGTVNPSFLETRGQIRAVLGDDAAAISDLEQAGKSLGMTRAIHQTLAKCYGRLGDEEQARRHAGLAEKAGK